MPKEPWTSTTTGTGPRSYLSTRSYVFDTKGDSFVLLKDLFAGGVLLADDCGFSSSSIIY
jgi:hypothetical protein